MKIETRKLSLWSQIDEIEKLQAGLRATLGETVVAADLSEEEDAEAREIIERVIRRLNALKYEFKINTEAMK